VAVTDAFETLAARLDYPMLIVTTAADGERAGCLVGFSTQCSIDPPRYLVCLSDKNHTYRVALRASTLAVHFPSKAHRSLSELFGEQTGDEVDKFQRCTWEPGPDGVPLLTDCPDRVVGRIIERQAVGDHTAFVLAIDQASVGPDEGFLPFTAVSDMEPGHEA
jgi:flavin reductase (DIM6/NTAB) family NADH-FMN oxidoreductase RutF